VSFSLGVGLRYVKKTKSIVPYLRGIMGVKLAFSDDADAEFQASIGPLLADVGVTATIDNYGEPLTILFGLNPNKNYYLSSNNIL
jgi:hypothetical protein